MRKVAISGANGFIGSHLLNYLNSSDYHVISVGRKEIRGFEHYHLDLTRPIYDLDFLRGVDTFVHCASIIDANGMDDSLLNRVNVTSCNDIVKACVQADVKQFIYLSTGGVYGFSDGILSEDNECKPFNNYTKSKYLAEKAISKFSQEIDVTILRIFFPFGKGQENRLISNIIHKIKCDEIVEFNAEGKPLINPIEINDLTQIIQFYINNSLPGVYNICGDETKSIYEISQLIAQLLGKNEFQYYFNDHQSGNLIGDNQKAKKITKHNEFTSINEGLKKIILK